ncbi:MAG: DNA gyrase inhibitor YacG [Desulfuromonadaceae bacterium]|nr:DNA gyrase inhibitor YacG [Geobacteraceae bacterium]
MKIKCPVCDKYADWSDNPSRPFCSQRCRNVDLGNWFDEDYRVAGEYVPDPEQNQPEQNSH